MDIAPVTGQGARNQLDVALECWEGAGLLKLSTRVLLKIFLSWFRIETASRVHYINMISNKCFICTGIYFRNITLECYTARAKYVERVIRIL